MGRLWMAAAMLALLTLAGCGAAAQPPLTPKTAEAAETFVETARVGDLDITLHIDPLSVGSNRLTVLTGDQAVKAVEAQVIMAAMGHGEVVNLTRTAPGRYEADSAAIAMNGRWIIRVVATPEVGESKTVVFNVLVP